MNSSWPIINASNLNTLYEDYNLGSFLKKESERIGLLSPDDTTFNKVAFIDFSSHLNLSKIKQIASEAGGLDKSRLEPILYIRVKNLKKLFIGIAFQDEISFFLETKFLTSEEIRVFCRVNLDELNSKESV
jgi:hypothetical protein